MRYIIFSCLIVLVCCIGCSNSSNGQCCSVDSIATPNQKIDVSDQNSVLETTPISDEGLSPFKCVVDTLNSAGDNLVHSEYFLYDITKDGTPELWVKSGTCEADMNLWVYSARNGGVKKILTATGGHMDFFLRGDTLGSVTCNCGGGYVSLYICKKGRIKVRSAEFSMWNEECKAKAINKSQQSIIDLWENSDSTINLKPLE